MQKKKKTKTQTNAQKQNTNPATGEPHPRPALPWKQKKAKQKGRRAGSECGVGLFVLENVPPGAAAWKTLEETRAQARVLDKPSRQESNPN